MKLDWEELKISQIELDTVFEPNLITTWAISLSRALLLHQRKHLKSLLFTEVSLLFVSLLPCFSLNLLIFRKLNFIANNSNGFAVVLFSTVILSILFIIPFNFVLWQKAKKIKPIGKLIDKVEKYNNLINSFQLIINVNHLASKKSRRREIEGSSNLKSFDELRQTLQLTKDSLLNSIELETFFYKKQIRQYKSSIYDVNRYQLLASLEHNLIDIASTEIASNQEYQELLNEAIDLGLSVHQEIRKIRHTN